MVISSAKELKNILLQKIKRSVKESQDKIYDIIHSFLERYYEEYEPKKYERTEQLLRSLVKSEITEDGFGYKAKIYFDYEDLAYKQATGWEVVNWAAHGTHGGYIKGTSVWDEPMEIFNGEAIKILLEDLKRNGIPIR